jgi:hypothetical protein
MQGALAGAGALSLGVLYGLYRCVAGGTTAAAAAQRQRRQTPRAKRE